MFLKQTKFWLVASCLMAGTAQADIPIEQSIDRLQHEWAAINYQASPDKKETAFQMLADQARQVTRSHPNRAEPLIWEAIILGGYASANGGWGALSAAKQARELLFAAEKINAQALEGSVYTVLGSLYYKGRDGR